MEIPQIRYITDEEGKPTDVIVPLEVWEEILAEQETAHLLASERMRERLLAAKKRREGIPIEVVREKLGI